MPIAFHPACEHPPDDTVLCRFMDFPKFRDLFANEELYLRRTDLFKETDPNEGLASDEYVRAARGLHRYDLRDALTLNNKQAFARQVSEAYYINCWQLFEGETLDMWKTYGQGVAVFSRLRSAADCAQPYARRHPARNRQVRREGHDGLQPDPVPLHETPSFLERTGTAGRTAML